MQIFRRAILALSLAAGLVPAFAAAPPPVPALPDTERRTSYSISGSTCACAVNFAIYGDSTDVDEWVEIWISGVRYLSTDPTFGWVLSSPTGPLSTIPRPITDAIITFNNSQTGTVQIVGARRPRRTSQFNENQGVAARDLNQVITDIVAQNRETWDKINDVTGRGLFGIPGENIATMPSAAARAGGYQCWDGTGLVPLACAPLKGQGNVSGPNSSTDGDFAVFNGTTGLLLRDQQFATLAHGGLGGSQAAATANQVPMFPGSGGPAVPTTITPPLISYTAPGTGGQTLTQQLANQRWVFASDYGVVGDGQNVSKVVSTVNGGSTLTVSVAQFTSADCNTGTGCTGPVNKNIMVTGAGAAGAPYAGTITSFTSSTVVGVSGTFGTTLTTSTQVVTYGTDNTAKLQNWINRLQTVQSIGILDGGAVYAMSGPVGISGPATIYGSGSQSILLATTPTMDVIDINTNSAVYLNNFYITGSQAATSGNMIQNTGSNANINSQFRNLGITGGFRGYFDVNAAQWVIDSSFFFQQTGVGIQTANANSCSAGNKWITNSTINTLAGQIAGLAITDSGVQFIHNKINGGAIPAGSAGILIQPASTCVTPTDVIIADSSIEGGQTTAVAMTKGSFSGTFANIIISGVQTQGQTNGAIIGDGNTNWIKHVAITGGNIYAGSGGTAISLTNSVVDAAINGAALANFGGGSSTGISIASTVTGSARGNVYDSSLTTPAANVSPNFLLEQSINGHTDYVGVAPTAALATCGVTGSTTVTGTDQSFNVTTGATAASGCVVVFAKSYSSAPRCTCSSASSGNSCSSVQTSTSGVTLSFTSAASQKFAVNCFGT